MRLIVNDSVGNELIIIEEFPDYLELSEHKYDVVNSVRSLVIVGLNKAGLGEWSINNDHIADSFRNKKRKNGDTILTLPPLCPNHPIVQT